MGVVVASRRAEASLLMLGCMVPWRICHLFALRAGQPPFATIDRHRGNHNVRLPGVLRTQQRRLDMCRIACAQRLDRQQHWHCQGRGRGDGSSCMRMDVLRMLRTTSFGLVRKNEGIERAPSRT